MYGRQVGSGEVDKSFGFDVDDEGRKWTNLFDCLSDSPLSRSIMMMLIVALAGVIALSTMISALKGIDDLLNN